MTIDTNLQSVHSTGLALRKTVGDQNLLRYLTRTTIDTLSVEFGNEIEEIFGVRTDCLTANESQYLLGFRTIDEIRNRCLKAKKEIDLRRASKKVESHFAKLMN